MNSTYSTYPDGTNFRDISKIMSDGGFPMNHATARNVLVTAFKMLLTNISTELQMEISEKKINDLFKNKELHDALSDSLFKIFKE